MAGPRWKAVASTASSSISRYRAELRQPRIIRGRPLAIGRRFWNNRLTVRRVLELQSKEYCCMVLGITAETSMSDIKRAFRRKVRVPPMSSLRKIRAMSG